METLSEKDAIGFLRELLRQKGQISLRALGADFVRLTMLIDLPVVDGTRYLVVDGVKGFEELVASDPHPRLLFECLDAKKIPYRFQAEFGKTQGSDIWLHFPHKVIRVQRRDFFRVDAPAGCTMNVPLGEGIAAFSIKDLSLGGAAVVSPRSRDMERLLEQAVQLEGIELHLVLEKEASVVRVKSARLRGMHPDLRADTFSCSFQFADIEAQERATLQSYLRRVERHGLRKLRGSSA